MSLALLDLTLPRLHQCMATILCVDDEAAVSAVLEHALTTMGHTPIVVSSVDDALATVAGGGIDLIISDYIMPGQTGLDLIRLLERDGYRVPVIIMTGFSSIENAVASIKTGAIDYLTKPVQADTLEVALNQAVELIRLRRENESIRSELRVLRSARQLVGESQPFRAIMDMIAMVAPTRATVLLQGESGTGKELFARAVHDQSPRADGPFITINCAAVPEGLVESALFGHEKGAFTGATVRTAGAFERAHCGTLLLDEISEMRLDLQAKLLRVIQEQEFERVGGSQAIKVDVRIIATTNRDLKAAVDEGRFRSDLYYRLNVMPIHTIALRERREDIPRLAHHFVQRAAEGLGMSPPAIAPAAMQLLVAADWPGNVRELGNAIERAVILSRNDTIQPHHFMGAQAAPAATAPDSFDLDTLERDMIDRALAATGGNRTRAAKLLGISERTLRNKLNGPKAAAAELTRKRRQLLP
jgi:DNA-binding NtrC family response regulator